MLEDAPKRPGVYMFKGLDNNYIYIGKAVNLFNRSRSYFLNFRRLDPRLQNMVEAAQTVEYHTVDNEVEALILEANLIKKYDPKFNVMLTDDKNYLWIKVFSNIDFPIVQVVRKKTDDGADYFGPYPASGPIRRLLKQLRKVLTYRSCTRIIEEKPNGTIHSSDKKPCLYYHLGMCSAPCTGRVQKESYRGEINSLKRFLRSENTDIKSDLKKRMQVAAEQRDYEAAGRLRDNLKDLEFLTARNRIKAETDEFDFEKLKQQNRIEGVSELIQKLALNYDYRDAELLQKFRIECYDISNIQGTNAVGAMVVSVAGLPNPKLYRKFKIKTKDSPDDFAMLQEMVGRRLKYLNEGSEEVEVKVDESMNEYPQLLVIDGGKGQVSAVWKILAAQVHQNETIRSIPMVGLAKKFEEIIVPIINPEKPEAILEFKVIKLSKRSQALKILQQLRDESHRFGLGYHRLLRSKGMMYSELDLVPGVGKVMKDRLITAFGSVDKIRSASLEQLEEVVRNRNTALKIKKLLV